MEKRNFVTSVRTPSSDTDNEGLYKSSEAFDTLVDKASSEFTKRAIEEDEKTDLEEFKKNK